jgi:hypothetical protein
VTVYNAATPKPCRWEQLKFSFAATNPGPAPHPYSFRPQIKRLSRTSGDTKMKKFMMMMFAMCLMFSMSAFAQGSMGSDSMKSDSSKKKSTSKSAAKSDETKVAGTITTDKAGKPALKADSDGKVWTIVNPEAVKGHEGHHVNVSGHPDAKTKSIHVMSVEMAGDSMKSDTKAKGKKKGTMTDMKPGTKC